MVEGEGQGGSFRLIPEHSSKGDQKMKTLQIACLILLAAGSLGVGLRYGQGNQVVTITYEGTAFVEKSWLTQRLRFCWLSDWKGEGDLSKYGPFCTAWSAKSEPEHIEDKAFWLQAEAAPR